MSIKNYNKYLSLSGMKTKYWGPNAWNFLFCSILGTYPEQIDIKNKDHIKIKKEFINDNGLSGENFRLVVKNCSGWTAFHNFLKELGECPAQ